MQGVPPRPGSHPPFDISDLPPLYGQAIQCNNWTHLVSNDPHNSFYSCVIILWDVSSVALMLSSPHSLQYSLPANESIYLRSNFSDTDDELQTPVTGSLLVSVSSNMTEKDAVVSVKMKDIGKEPLKMASVCLMRAADGWGLAIYVRISASIALPTSSCFTS